jgi:hypothetical protein
MTRSLLAAAVLSAATAACQPGADARAVARAAGGSATTAVQAPGATAFVRAFYAAYAPRARASGLAALDSVLRERPADFTPTLGAALRANAAARAGAAGEIDGLDGDPFLNAQDPCEQYVVGDAAAAPPPAPPAAVRVPVYAVCGGKRGADPAAIVEVVQQAGGWAVANVHYAGPPDDLLSRLARLRS